MPDLSDEELVELMEDMVFARTLHEETTKYSRQGRLGFYGPTLGQEASQMGSAYAFEENDWLYGGYRDLPQLISHGASVAQGFLWSKGHVNGGWYGEEGEVNAMVPQIIIGAQYIQATGNALGQKLKGEDAVTFTYTGDGGTSQGDFYEGLNFAGRYQVPAVFIVQNNGYAISTPRELATNAGTLAQKSAAVGIPGVQVDGMDVLAVYAVTKQAREWAAAGNGPVLIETITSRMGPHSTAGDDPTRYRDQESFDYWEARDPLDRYRTFLEEKELWDEDHEEEIIEKFQEEIADGMKEAESQPEMTVTESLKWQYANPPANILEQIEEYEEKESNQ
jgi:pyruvate dehydrogenase E1 component alpha subunit